MDGCFINMDIKYALNLYHINKIIMDIYIINDYIY